MSFIKKSAKQAVKLTPTKENFKISIVPNPAVKHSVAKAAAQKDIIQQMQNQAYDLLAANQAVKHEENYKTKGLYANHVSVDDLVNAMQNYDLVMKVKGVKRACLQLTAAELQNANGEIEKAFPLSGGTLKMGFTTSRGNKYISTLDHIF